jgi:hypothetical protein
MSPQYAVTFAVTLYHTIYVNAEEEEEAIESASNAFDDDDVKWGEAHWEVSEVRITNIGE